MEGHEVDSVSLDEVGKRYSLFYLLGSVASAVSGILAYGVCL
jgi:hypothetical protein